MDLPGKEKVYADKLHKIVTDISHLTLLEVADLNELLKVRDFRKLVETCRIICR